MSIEQTDQLLQLILNSLLLVIAHGLVLSGLLMQHATLRSRLQTLRDRSVPSPSVPKLQVRQLRQHYRSIHYSVIAAYYGLGSAVASTLVVAFRTFIPWNGLIQGALVLFLLSVGLGLLSIGLTLLVWQMANQFPWEGGIASGAAFSKSVDLKLTDPKLADSKLGAPPSALPLSSGASSSAGHSLGKDPSLGLPRSSRRRRGPFQHPSQERSVGRDRMGG